MMPLFRRCRSLAVVLLLAAPGLGASWLPVVHPCVVDSPWLAPDGGHHSHQAPDATDSETCHCIGSSQARSPALLPIAAALALATVPVERISRTPLFTPDPPIQRPVDRLPPATAPPLI
jgi:hypothetical protein